VATPKVMPTIDIVEIKEITFSDRLESK